MNRIAFRVLVFLVALPVIGAQAETVVVDSKETLIKAAQAAKPGDVIQIKPGTYPGGIYLSGIQGSAEKPIVIESANSEPGVVWFSGKKGGNSAIHLSGCSHVILRKLTIMDFPVNGINADDGGDSSRPSTGLHFEFVTFQNIGPRGNHDGLKLSGVREFSVRYCIFRGWGGSAIDMVGCHEGVIFSCGFTGEPECSQSSGVQMKGGSSKIRVIASHFENAGERAINLGGSTGLPFFRPADSTWEASDIEVAGNVFQSSLAPIAWVGIDGGYVHHNIIFKPEKWVARILQQNTDPRFGRCRNGRFEKNLVVFDKRVQTFINVGGNTEPDTFTFSGNAWFDSDDPKRGPSRLPVEESGSVIGVDPEFGDSGDGFEFKIQSKDPRLKGIGPEAFPLPAR